MKTLFMFFSLATTLAVAPSSILAGSETGFYFTSSPQSWVGHGYTRTLSSVQAMQCYSSMTLQQCLQFKVADPHNVHGYWWVNFDAPLDEHLRVGLFDNATRFPFNTYGPGLSFVGDGRGDNTLTGWFEILELSITGNTLNSFAADFIQYDEGKLEWWNYGSIRYNSAIPIDTTVPEPASAALLAVGLTALVALRYRK